MLARCLKSFELSRDGVTSTPIAAGDEIDAPDELAPGLIAEGFIARLGDPEPETPDESAPRRAKR